MSLPIAMCDPFFAVLNYIGTVVLAELRTVRAVVIEMCLIYAYFLGLASLISVFMVTCSIMSYIVLFKVNFFHS
jgi:hypothetical protein